MLRQRAKLPRAVSSVSRGHCMLQRAHHSLWFCQEDSHSDGSRNGARGGIVGVNSGEGERAEEGVEMEVTDPQPEAGQQVGTRAVWPWCLMPPWPVTQAL